MKQIDQLRLSSLPLSLSPFPFFLSRELSPGLQLGVQLRARFTQIKRHTKLPTEL